MNLEHAVQAIEDGLLEPKSKDGTQPEKKELAERMSLHMVPGIRLALVDQGEVVWAKGYGPAEAGSERQVTPASIFQAGSISKPVSAMVALHLEENGVLDLDTDIKDTLRSWKAPESKHNRVRRNGEHPVVTLRGLLSHTAGFLPRGYRG
jgi:CubicO group peptidase (beta-lactamase class C family)